MFILSCLYLSLLFHVIKLYLVASPLESYAMTKNSLKCQRNCEESSLVIGESVDLAFEDSNNIRQDIISCKWIFIPLHDRNYVEMHARNVQATDCSISYIAVYVSNKFTKKICDFESICGFKFIGKSISLSYNCLNSSRCGYKLEVTVRETSPVYAGCDFTMTEMGYRYYLKYDLIDSKAETSNQVKNGCPFPGMSLDNIRYNLYFMNRENLGVTTCFQDQIILPREDVPSCHASTEDCEWKLIEGIEKVNEIFELRGPQWKITKEGLFQTKSRNIQIESFCLYFEYFLDNVEMARITIVSYQPKQFPRTREVHVNENLTSKVWTIKRFVGDINQKRGRNDLKTMFELRIRIHDNKNNGAMYINKIYGCDPFTKEDRIFIPTGPRKMLYGSFRKESNETNCCENGGKWIDEKCICPIGFNGKHCRVDCGENRYGHNCGLECDLFKKGCEDIIICDDFLGCSCAPGFKGRYCQDCGSSSLYEEYEYFDKETCANGTGRSFATCRNVLDPPDCTNSIPRYSMVTIPRYIKFDEVSVFWSKEEVNNSTCDVKMLQFTIRSGSNLKRYMVMSHLIYFTFKNLRSGTKYTVRMKPILKGDPLCPFLTFTTPHRHPREF